MGKRQPISKKKYENICKQNEEIREMYKEMVDEAYNERKKVRFLEPIVKYHIWISIILSIIGFLLGLLTGIKT